MISAMLPCHCVMWLTQLSLQASKHRRLGQRRRYRRRQSQCRRRHSFCRRHSHFRLNSSERRSVSFGRRSVSFERRSVSFVSFELRARRRRRRLRRSRPERFEKVDVDMSPTCVGFFCAVALFEHILCAVLRT